MKKTTKSDKPLAPAAKLAAPAPALKTAAPATPAPAVSTPAPAPKVKAKVVPVETAPKAATPAPVAAKPAPAPVVAAPVAKPAAPVAAAAPAAAKPAAAPSKTEIVAHADVGFGNSVFIRGDGPGLSWNKGLLLNCTASDRWSISLENIARPFAFKLVLNDKVWCDGPDFSALPGGRVSVEPKFTN